MEDFHGLVYLCLQCVTFRKRHDLIETYLVRPFAAGYDLRNVFRDIFIFFDVAFPPETVLYSSTCSALVIKNYFWGRWPLSTF